MCLPLTHWSFATQKTLTWNCAVMIMLCYFTRSPLVLRCAYCKCFAHDLNLQRPASCNLSALLFHSSMATWASSRRPISLNLGLRMYIRLGSHSCSSQNDRAGRSSVFSGNVPSSVPVDCVQPEHSTALPAFGTRNQRPIFCLSDRICEPFVLVSMLMGDFLSKKMFLWGLSFFSFWSPVVPL